MALSLCLSSGSDLTRRSEQHPQWLNGTSDVPISGRTFKPFVMGADGTLDMWPELPVFCTADFEVACWPQGSYPAKFDLLENLLHGKWARSRDGEKLSHFIEIPGWIDTMEEDRHGPKGDIALVQPARAAVSAFDTCCSQEFNPDDFAQIGVVSSRMTKLDSTTSHIFSGTTFVDAKDLYDLWDVKPTVKKVRLLEASATTTTTANATAGLAPPPPFPLDDLAVAYPGGEAQSFDAGETNDNGILSAPEEVPPANAESPESDIFEFTPMHEDCESDCWADLNSRRPSNPGRRKSASKLILRSLQRKHERLSLWRNGKMCASRTS
jgi:hypothetical protein